jgi:transcriptional regulator with XRE-family HTH domain
MSTGIARKIESIKQFAGISGNNIAQLVGATPQTLSRWTTGKNAPQPEHLSRLLELEYLAGELAEFFEQGDVKLWLMAPHPELGGKAPMELLRNNRFGEIRDVIERMRDSSYV